MGRGNYCWHLISAPDLKPFYSLRLDFFFFFKFINKVQNVCCPFSPSLLGLLSLQPDQHGLLGKYTTYNFLKSTFHILMFIFKKPLQRKEPLIYKSLISITEWESVFYQIMTKTKCSRPLQYSTLQHKDFFFHLKQQIQSQVKITVLKLKFRKMTF